MNWIDLLLVALVLLALWTGWQRGFISGTLGLLCWVGSFLAGYLLYPFGVGLIEHFSTALGVWVKPLAFLGIVVIARAFLSVLSYVILQQTTPETHQNILNKSLGLVPGFVNGLIQAIIVAALFLTIPFQNRVSDAARDSRLANAAAPPAFWLEHALAPIFSEPLHKTLPNTTIEPKPNETVKLPFKVAHATVRSDLEAQMLVLVNEEREKAGLKPLAADPELQAVARAHSNDMFVRGYFAHVDPDGKDPFDRMQAAGVHFLTAGENLALAQTLQQAHEGLMHSPGHRANILQKNFGRVGIGILDGGIYGLMVSQEFRN
jgi:uncharacterized protein YkwD